MFTVIVSGVRYKVTWQYKHPRPNDLKGIPLMSLEEAQEFFEKHGVRPPRRMLKIKYAHRHETHCVISQEDAPPPDFKAQWVEVSRAVAIVWKGGCRYDEDDKPQGYFPPDVFNKNQGRKRSLGLALKNLVGVYADRLSEADGKKFWDAYDAMCKPKTADKSRKDQPTATASAV